LRRSPMPHLLVRRRRLETDPRRPSP
jgi:hypothetical protein